MLFTELVANISLGVFTDILADELSAISWIILGLGLIVDIAALRFSGGASLAFLIAVAGLSLDSFGFDVASVFEKCQEEPSMSPSFAPTTREPTLSPTDSPSAQPTTTKQPTIQPTERPTGSPTTSPAPTFAPTTLPPTTGPGRTSGVFGDPHLSTFDRLRFDCQASGEFTST